MANRTAHVTLGLILALIYIPLDFLIINKIAYGSINIVWTYWVLGFLLAIIGAEGPDFDQLYNFMTHRDIVSHSAFYPGIIFALSMWWRFTYNDPLISCFIPFILAYGSHLFIDFFPNIDIRKLRDGKLRIGEKKGSFLMHVPIVYRDKEGEERRTLGVKKTEFWLLGNSFLCTIMAFLLALARYYANIPI